MEWWCVVLGASLLAFIIGVTIGLLIPKAGIEDIWFMRIYLFLLFVFTVIGMSYLAYGLRK